MTQGRTRRTAALARGSVAPNDLAVYRKESRTPSSQSDSIEGFSFQQRLRALPIRSHRTQPTKDTARWRFGNNTINILPFCGTAVNLVVAHRPVAGGRARAEFSRQTPLHSSRAASCRVPPPAARRKGQSRGGEREGEGAKMEERERERERPRMQKWRQSVSAVERGREGGRPLALRPAPPRTSQARRQGRGRGRCFYSPSFLPSTSGSIHPSYPAQDGKSVLGAVNVGWRAN